MYELFPFSVVACMSCVSLLFFYFGSVLVPLGETWFVRRNLQAKIQNSFKSFLSPKRICPTLPGGWWETEWVSKLPQTAIHPLDLALEKVCLSMLPSLINHISILFLVSHIKFVGIISVNIEVYFQMEILEIWDDPSLYRETLTHTSAMPKHMGLDSQIIEM